MAVGVHMGLTAGKRGPPHGMWPATNCQVVIATALEAKAQGQKLGMQVLFDKTDGPAYKTYHGT
jgi:hypothetical protein